MEALRRTTAKLAVVCQQGRIAVPSLPHVLYGLLDEPQCLLGIAQASGVAVLVSGEVRCVGDTPDGDSVTRLAEHFAADAATAAGHIVATRQLGVEAPTWAGRARVASGVLAFRMPEPVQGWVLWFRPELVQTVHWGGDPDKQVSIKLDESGVPRLHPRRSFAAWQEQLRGRSLPWGEAERRLVADLRRSAIELDMARQVEKESEAVRARDDLVAVVSHDLRTPMGVISMQAVLIQRLMQQSLGQVSPRLLSSAQVIHRAADRMAVLLQDLLDLAKIEAGRFDVAATAQPLVDMLQDEFELLLPMAQNQRVDLHLDAVPAVNVRADPERIFQVLSNLVSNAIKFTPAGGNVALRARIEGSHAVIEVQDTGTGIAPEQLPRIFDRYWQARHASTAGTGLGLYIAKGIVQAHGGTIMAASEVGQGTTMSFTLPLAA
jgi:light-regulated signal transduction histidine kinase (bacteriophytochrome)